MLKNVTVKKTAWKIWLIALFSILIAVNMVAIVVMANTNKFVWGDIAVENEYLVGDTLTVPTVKVTHDGTEYESEFVLKVPNGQSIADEDGVSSTPSQFTFLTSGKYKLIYVANVKGETVATEKEFIVKEELFSVSSKNSSVSYGEDVSHYKSGKVGLNLSLASGDVFKYGKVIDFNGKTSSDKIITFICLPEIARDMEVDGLNITLTDAYNPTNIVEIQLKNSNDTSLESAWDYTYASAAAINAGQVTTGYTPTVAPYVQVNTPFGASDYFSFHGESFYHGIKETGTSAAPDRDISVSFDYASRQLFLDGKLICDLDDEYFFNNLWGGFKTGKAFLKVEGRTFYRDKANFLITGIMGQDLSEENVLNKDAKPTFTFEDNGLDLDNLTTVAGYEFPVFKATAVNDYTSISPITVKAFSGYYSTTKNELEIVNGCIRPNKAGLITLEYSVTEYSGEVFKKLIDITVQPEKTISATLNAGYTQQSMTGKIVDVAPCTVTGSIGKVSKKVEITRGNSVVEVVNDTFKPEYEGEYKVVITYTDLIGQQVSVDYTVAVTKNPSPIFEDEIVIPEYFVVGTDYVLPNLVAYDYYDGRKQVNAEIYVDGVKGSNTVNFKADGNHVIKYVATTSVGSSERIYNVVAVNVKEAGRIRLERYFVCQNAVVTIDTKGAHFNSANSSENASATFINYLSSYDFVLNFVINPEKTAYDTLDFYLTDVMDSTNEVKISFSLSDLKVYVNDIDTGIIVSSTNLFDTEGKYFCELAFDSRTGTVSVDGAEYVIDNYGGTTKNLIKFNVVANGVHGDAGFTIRKVVNQMIRSTIKADAIEPSIVYNGKYNVYENLGVKLTVFSAVASDVLSPLKNTYVKVVDDKGNVVNADDGTAMNMVSFDKEYVITLSSYGLYTIEYYAEDNLGNYTLFSDTITVIDKVKPTIELKENLQKTAKVGDTITLPEITASDNLSTELTVQVYVLNPDNGLRTMLKGNSFVVSVAGVYQVSFMCVDDAGNVAFMTRYISVEGE